MIRRPPTQILIWTLILVTLTPALSRAQGRVEDRAGFFSPDAVSQAQATIAQIRKDYGKDVVVETFPALPSNVAGSYRESDKDAFFRQWAQQRRDALNVDGVYVLINKNPSYLRAEVGSDTARDAFTHGDSQELTQRMLPLMGARQFDEALTSGTVFIHTRMNERAVNLMGGPEGDKSGATAGDASRTTPAAGTRNDSPAPQQRSPGMSMWTWVLLIIGIFIAVRLIRRFFAARTQVPMGQRPSYGPPDLSGNATQQGGGNWGGGGFGRGAMGGLLGGLAGGWLYDRMFRHGGGGGGSSSDAYGAPVHHQADTHDDVHSDLTGSGGSFGGDSDFGSSGGGDDTGSGGSF